MSQNLEKTYNPKEIEDKLYQKWCENKYFHAEVDRSKKPFTIVMPPPNITGKLHMGHALDNTMQDILIRYKRMQGYNALWIPGTDHAAISTEVKVTNQLKDEGIDKKELGREKFLERTWHRGHDHSVFQDHIADAHRLQKAVRHSCLVSFSVFRGCVLINAHGWTMGISSDNKHRGLLKAEKNAGPEIWRLAIRVESHVFLRLNRQFGYTALSSRCQYGL